MTFEQWWKENGKRFLGWKYKKATENAFLAGIEQTHENLGLYESRKRNLALLKFGKDFWQWFTSHYGKQQFPWDADSEDVMNLTAYAAGWHTSVALETPLSSSRF